MGLIYMIFLYQLGSWSSENMMSKDSKNGFGSSVAAIETHSKPLKVVASIQGVPFSIYLFQMDLPLKPLIFRPML